MSTTPKSEQHRQHTKHTQTKTQSFKHDNRATIYFGCLVSSLYKLFFSAFLSLSFAENTFTASPENECGQIVGEGEKEKEGTREGGKERKRGREGEREMRERKNEEEKDRNKTQKKKRVKK